MSTSSLTRVKFKGSLELVVAVFEEKLPLKTYQKNAKEKRHQQLHEYISKKRNVEHVQIIKGNPPSVSRRWDVTDRPESALKETDSGGEAGQPIARLRPERSKSRSPYRWARHAQVGLSHRLECEQKGIPGIIPERELCRAGEKKRKQGD